MSTRYKVDPFKTQGGMETGLEGIETPEDFDIPSCGIEDVDRAMFKLFNEDIPLYYELNGDMKRIPCIFASGERAFILRKKQPLRDRQGALILPLVSILRSGIDQDSEKGIGPGNGLITIKKRLAPENRQWKRLANQEGLLNQDNVKGEASGEKSANLKIETKNIYEVITIPSPRFYKATYEITFWAQYLQQMNNILEAFISSYNVNPAKTFKIEADNGYWFVATVESSLNDNSNFDGFEDDERLIKSTATISVTGYIVNPKFPGAPNPMRRYVSAPRISFETTDEDIVRVASSKLPSYDPDDYVFNHLNTTSDPLPGPAVGLVDPDGPEFSVNIGGQRIFNEEDAAKVAYRNVIEPIEIEDPFGSSTVKASVKAKNLSKGETVYSVLGTLDRD